MYTAFRSQGGCVRQYTNNDWSFHFFLRQRTDGTYEGAAEIHHGGALWWEVASSAPTRDREEMLQALMLACQKWVRDCRRRLQNVETVAAELH
jgi:hypothetical protein